MFLCSKTWKIFIQITSKGIPHDQAPFEYHKDYNVDKATYEEALKISTFLGPVKDGGREDTKVCYDKVQLKKRYFITRREGKDPEVKTHITWQDFLDVSKGEAMIECLFSCMVRSLSTDPDIKHMGIGLDFKRRNLASQLWWNKGKRNFVKDKFITTPLGFNMNLIQSFG